MNNGRDDPGLAVLKRYVPLDSKEDGGRSPHSRKARSTVFEYEQKPGSHLDNSHYIGGLSFVDELRAFGPPPCPRRRTNALVKTSP